MESEPDFGNQLLLSPSPESELPTKLKRLKKNNLESNDHHQQILHGSDELPRESEPDIEPDGLDPLFSQGVNRVLQFNDAEDADFELETTAPATKPKKKKDRRQKSDGKPKVLKRKAKEERKAYLAQQADFQRVMRERKCVGFKPLPMVEKPITSILEKIRLRKMEVSKKLERVMPLRSNDSVKEIMLDSDSEDEDSTLLGVLDNRLDKQVLQEPVANAEPSVTVESSRIDILDSRLDKKVLPEPVAHAKPSVIVESSRNDTPTYEAADEDQPVSSDLQSPTKKPLVDQSVTAFRAPVDDTQDLFSDSQTSDSQGDRLNEKSSGNPVEDVSPSLPSLNLKFDSAFADDISSDEEESDKENTDPHPKPLHKDSFSAPGDPLKQFLDVEALEDDSDDDLLHSDDNDEEDDAYMEENCDYVATDIKEKPIDHETRNELHQKWLQQQDDAGTENLLQKLKHGVKQIEPSFLKDEDDCEIEEDESDNEDSRDLIHTTSACVTTKRLKQMIPQMFTDNDDGFVSSDDEETERRLSKQQLLQRVELKQQSKFLSPEEIEMSKEVFGRIRKLNAVPETKKKAKTSSLFDALLTKGSGSISTKSSFLQRAASHPVPSSRRHGPSIGKSFIFGRDDSRSSSSLIEDSPDVNQNEHQVKKSASAKFTSSQAKWCTQHTQTRGEKVPGTSLFEILKQSSMKAVHDAQDNLVDHQAVSAAFQSVKKRIKVEGRS